MMLEWLSTLDPVLPSISGDQDDHAVELYDSFGKMSIDLGGNPGSLPSSFDLLPGLGHDAAQPDTAKSHQQEHVPRQQSQLEPQPPALDQTMLPLWPPTPQVPQQANNIIGAVSLQWHHPRMPQQAASPSSTDKVSFLSPQAPAQQRATGTAPHASSPPPQSGWDDYEWLIPSTTANANELPPAAAAGTLLKVNGVTGAAVPPAMHAASAAQQCASPGLPLRAATAGSAQEASCGWNLFNIIVPEGSPLVGAANSRAAEQSGSTDQQDTQSPAAGRSGSSSKQQHKSKRKSAAEQRPLAEPAGGQSSPVTPDSHPHDAPPCSSAAAAKAREKELAANYRSQKKSRTEKAVSQ